MVPIMMPIRNRSYVKGNNGYYITSSGVKINWVRTLKEAKKWKYG